MTKLKNQTFYYQPAASVNMHKHNLHCRRITKIHSKVAVLLIGTPYFLYVIYVMFMPIKANES